MPARRQNASVRRLPIDSVAFREIAAFYDGENASEGAQQTSDGESHDQEPIRLPQTRRPVVPTITPAAPGYANIVAGTSPERPSDVDLSASKRAWHKIWRQQQHAGLAKEVMAHEIGGRLKGSPTLRENDTEWAADVMTDILMSSEDCLVESVAFGNLARDRRRNRRLASILKRLWKKAEWMPSIYHQQLVNKFGESPSANELRKVIGIMRDYAFGTKHPRTRGLEAKVDDRMAHEIDITRHEIDPQSSRQGFRKFLWTEKSEEAGAKKSRAPPPPTGRINQIRTEYEGSRGGKRVKVQQLSEQRIKELLLFCDKLEDRLLKLPPSERDKPLEHPLVEVGYSIRSITRLDSHAKHESSNYIMNLMEAIFEVLSGDDSTMAFRVEQAVIYLIWTVEQAELSEIGWTKLAEGYTGNGGGFSHYPAGRSNRSAHTVPASEWAYAMLVALHGSPLSDNVKRGEAVKDRETEKNVLELRNQSLSLLKDREESRTSRFAEELQEMVLTSATDAARNQYPDAADLEAKIEEKESELRSLVAAHLKRLQDRVKLLKKETSLLAKPHWDALFHGMNDAMECLEIQEESEFFDEQLQRTVFDNQPLDSILRLLASTPDPSEDEDEPEQLMSKRLRSATPPAPPRNLYEYEEEDIIITSPDPGRRRQIQAPPPFSTQPRPSSRRRSPSPHFEYEEIEIS